MTNENSTPTTISSADELLDMNLELLAVTAFVDSDEYTQALDYFDGDSGHSGLAGTVVEFDAHRAWKDRVVEIFESAHNLFLEDSDFIFDNWSTFFYGE